MQLNHAFTVPASVQATWDTFMDLDLVGSCFPGATVTEASADGFAGSVKVKLGPIALVYTGVGSFVEKDEATHTAVIKANGKDKRGNGTAGATVKIQLSDVEGVTNVDVATDLAITGKPAQFGRGVMQDVSDKLLGQFVSCIEGKLGSDSMPAAASPAATAAEAVAAEDVSESAQAHTDTGASSTQSAAAAASAEVPVTAAPAAGTEKAAETEKAVPPATPAPATRPAPTSHPAKDDNSLNGLALVPVVLKSLWHRLLVVLRLRRREE